MFFSSTRRYFSYLLFLSASRESHQSLYRCQLISLHTTNRRASSTQFLIFLIDGDVFLGELLPYTPRTFIPSPTKPPKHTENIWKTIRANYQNFPRCAAAAVAVLGGKIEYVRESNFPSSQIFIMKFITPHLLIILGTYIIHMILDTSRERISATHPEFFFVKVIYFQFSLFIKPCSDTLRIYYPPSFFSVHNKYFFFSFTFLGPSLVSSCSR